MRHGQYHLIHEILINWYKKCTSASLLSDGPMLKEEMVLIKERLNKDDFTSFTASNSWLEKFKLVYGFCETRITGEADDTPRMTIQSWIERLPELTTGCELKNIWNMDKLGYSLTPCQKRALLKNREVVKVVKSLSNVLRQHFL